MRTAGSLLGTTAVEPHGQVVYGDSVVAKPIDLSAVNPSNSPEIFYQVSYSSLSPMLRHTA